MTAFDPTLDAIARWQQAQEAFWSAAASTEAFSDPSAFLPPDWPAADDLLERFLAGFLPDEGISGKAGQAWRRLIEAGAAYRRTIDATWAEIRMEFEAARIALQGAPGARSDWRIFRDRWFAIAETAFIRLQRKPEFLSAQRDVLMALASWLQEQHEPVRAAIRAARAAQKTGQNALLGVTSTSIAETPRTKISQIGKTVLYRYLPLRPASAPVGTVLICYGLIGRQSMTDLVPERSMVRNLLAHGVDVFVIDWGSAGPEDRENDLDHFVRANLGRCVRTACEAAEIERLTLFGICQGGTFAACYASLQTGDLNGLICAGTPIDLHADTQDADPAHGLLNLWARSMSEDDLQALIGMEQNLSGDFLGAVFNQLNPIRTLSRYVIDFPDSARDIAQLRLFLAMETWLADRPDLPEALARTWLLDVYKRNALVEGELRIGRRPVDLSNIGVPVLNMTATGDHIVPPPCSRALGRFVPQDRYRELSVPAGHIGMFVGGKAQTLVAPEIVRWLHTIR
ncbi:MAG: alpha/beta fold hydrolase [Pseudomonadota bacterium]